ncbi:MFS transporter [Yoonia maritima]|uniref:MFS transporter n=1 Tax=Yoonia maritima TaxID=1435347 RepID=UPI0013A628C3|nr:MFS transporter [Yoonia maritima]
MNINKVLLFAASLQFLGTASFNLSVFGAGLLLLREAESIVPYIANGFVASFVIACFGPFAGNISDRIGRTQSSLIISLLAMGVSILALTLGSSSVWAFLTLSLTLASALFMSTLSVVAMSSARLTSSKVEQIGSVLSKVQIAEQAGRIVAPLLIVLLFPIGLWGLAITQALLFSVAICVIVAFRTEIGKSETMATPKEANKALAPTPIREMFGLIRRDSLLRVFAPYLAVSTACVELSILALTPVALSIMTEQLLATAFMIANVSAVMGGLLATRLTPRWSVSFAIFIFISIEAAGAMLFAMQSQTTNLYVYAAALCFGYFIMPTSLISAQVAWLANIPKQDQGVAAGLERTSSWLLVPLAYLIGPLVVPPSSTSFDPEVVSAFRSVALYAAIALFVASILFLMTRPVRLLIQKNSPRNA